jgi:hypothetical protein
MATPFPALHARANKAAAEKVERAKAARDRAGELLDELDEIDAQLVTATKA